jgi:NAD(P)-dependent dehydrogenase (short-subunit alcohol dehydrogenase family)
MENMNGKVVMITGATNGIGQVTARELARQGANVIGVGRDQQKCEQVAEQIKIETRNPNVEFLTADLSIQAQIRQLVEEFQHKYDRLDVLVNNAGGYFQRRVISQDGIEMTLALDHLNYFLLTNLLLEQIKASAPARIVNVSSGAHMGGKINFADIELKRGYYGWNAYAQSKLANVLFTYELDRRLGDHVSVNALHPGFVASNFGMNNGGVIKLSMKFVHRFSAISPEKGAQTSIYLASSPEVEGISGKYFFEQQPIPSSPESYNEETAAKLWEVSEEMTRMTH